MRYLRIVLGVLLLAAALGGLYFWETAGRTSVMMEEALVAARDLGAGAVIEDGMLAVAELPKGSVAKAGFRPGDEKLLLGKALAYPISGRQQFTADSFVDESEGMKKGESYFVIPAGWIAMRSSSLRRGDDVEIFGDAASDSFGVYRLAFVKNAGDGEVKDVSARGDVLSVPVPRNRRVDADSMVDHVEIIATVKAYYRLKEYVESRDGAPSLALVRVDGA